MIEAQEKAYKECLVKLDNLVSLKTSPLNFDGSQLSDQEYGQRRGVLLKEKASLEELLGDSGQRVEQQLKLAEATFEFACTAQDRFARGNAKTKKEMLLTLGSNLTLKDQKLLIEAREPFFLMESSMSTGESTPRPIEPRHTGLSRGRNGSCSITRPHLLGDRDSNPDNQDQNLMSYH